MRKPCLLLLICFLNFWLIFPAKAEIQFEFETNALADSVKEKAHVKKDSLSKQGKFFAGSGIQVIGYNSDIDGFFTFYQFYGMYWYASQKISYTVCAEPVRLNWTTLDSAKHGSGFDKARYFSFSSAVTSGIRYAFKQDKYKYRALELGAGYNLPWYYRLKKKNEQEKVIVEDLGKMNDAFGYFRFQYDLFTFRAEYHPFDLVKDPLLPEPAKLLIGLELIIASD